MTPRLVLALDRVGEDLGPETAILEPCGISVEYPSDVLVRREQQFHQAEGMLLNKTPVDAGFFDGAPRCRAIVTYGVGHDHIDLGEAERRSMIVANVPDYCTDEVADHTMALLLTIARGISGGQALVQSGGWGLDGIGSLHRLRGRALGLIGLGRIARAVARRAEAFGLQALAYDPAFTPGNAPEINVRVLPTLTTVLRASDIVSLHLPLSAGTRGLIGQKALREFKPGAILINTSRGGLLDLDAVVEALRDGRLAGAGLDVFPDEPPDPRRIAHPNLVATPHIAYYSIESQQELKESAARAMAAALTGLPVANLLTRVAATDRELVT